MCMIAHRFLSPKGKGSNIPNTVIDTAIGRHPDGFGVAWRDAERGLVYDKFAPWDKDKFRALLKELDADQSVEYVAHFRYATHGPEDEAHAHPYGYMDPDPEVGAVLVFHNGVISWVKTTPKESDTEVFVRDFLAKLPSRWWTNEGIRALVDQVGGWSRLVLMTDTETVNLNHGEGTEDGGLWYSSDHKPYTYKTNYTKPTATAVYASSYTDDDDWELNDGKWYPRTSAFGAIERVDPAAVTEISPLLAQTTEPRSNTAQWMHQGHELDPIQSYNFAVDGDYPNSIVCETCGTIGDVYIIDGRAFIDVPHQWDNRDDGDEERTVPGLVTLTEAEALLPDEMEDLLPENDGSIVREAAVALLTDGKPKLTIMQGASGTEYARVN